MKKLGLLSAAVITLLAGCSSSSQQDDYQDVSFELCGTEVKVYSVSEDGKVRIVCKDESRFTLKKQATLDKMRDINIDYCTGEGLARFNETDRYYSFRCKSGTNLSINK